jgi:hypothetical protein
MSYQQSLMDKVSRALAPVIRRISDISVILTGTRVNLLRISKGIDPFTNKRRDVLGDRAPVTWTATVLSNVIIKYPFSKVEIFAERKGNDMKFHINGYDMMEFLPVELSLQFTGSNAESDPIDIVKGDYIVDVLYDEHNNPIPFVMEVTKTYGSFFVKDIVSKTAEMTLVRGTLDAQIQNEIDKYIENIRNGVIR